MFNWLMRLITEPPVIRNRDKIKKLVQMTGISPDEQARLNDLCLHISDENLERARTLAEYYELRGAKFVYILENGKLKRNPEVLAFSQEPPQREDFEDYEAYEKAKQRHDYKQGK